MKELRDKSVTRALIREISGKIQKLGRPVRLMEVCGTHTMTIHRFGLKPLLDGAGVEMVSGPGCPVCITPNEIHEACLDLLTGTENLILASFGDMTRVPTRKGSLQTAIPAASSRLKLVYSPEESVELARDNPGTKVERAQTERLENYSVMSALWLIPPALRWILDAGETTVNGFLYPGHVSAIIGTRPYQAIADDYGVPGSVAGFEPNDILLSISAVIDQMLEGKPRVHLEYGRAVSPDGNLRALDAMDRVFEPEDGCWRGLGCIPRSSLRLRPAYLEFDAQVKHGLRVVPGSGDLPGCRCGEVLRGLIAPPGCAFFGKRCRPDAPYGPCMVSLEGACYVYHKYGRDKHLGN
jgi:hydrogenase expression/formation protein HypD